jgi:excisionase family DNA binding protein
MAIRIRETPPPTEADARRAQESLELISQFPAFGTSDLSIRIPTDDQGTAEVLLPASAVRVLKDILAEMAQGRAVAVLPVQAEVTTQQAANLLSVSRPYLIGLLEHRKIPFRLVGQHRRIRIDDLLAFKRGDDEERERAADLLSADAQELGMGY